MIEQWFLDLDGVRSGPYQTPEVMSLIAEGEVLPHHRISTSLREQRWVTILDWRLDQAKITQHTSVPSPFSSARSEISSIEGLEEVPTESFLIPDTTHEGPPKPAPIVMESAPLQSSSVPPLETNEIAQSIQADAASHANTPPTSVLSGPKNGADAGDGKTTPRPKRDPMAEMFDMLQNTKQKREAKQNTAALGSVTTEHDHPAPPKSGSFLRSLMIGGGITLVGFALGQIFQQTAPPKDPSTLATKSAPNFVPIPNPAATTGVIEDRSTDKVTIRTVKERKDLPAPTPPPAVKIPSRNLHAGSNDNPQTEKEIEELRNLKKELQELKALKNNNLEDDTDVMAPEGDGFDAKEPGAEYPNNMNPNGGSNTAPSETNPPNSTPPDAYPSR